MKAIPLIAAVCSAFLCARGNSAELRVPAFTAYLDPNPEGARVSSRSGITGWSDPKLKILWFGELKAAGPIEPRIELRLPQGIRSKLRLSVAGASKDVEVSGAGSEVVAARFGEFKIKEPGYQRFVLESLNSS